RWAAGQEDGTHFQGEKRPTYQGVTRHLDLLDEGRLTLQHPLEGRGLARSGEPHFSEHPPPGRMRPDPQHLPGVLAERRGPPRRPLNRFGPSFTRASRLGFVLTGRGPS